MTAQRTEIIILATRTQSVLGEKGRRIRELTSIVQKRFGFESGAVEVRVDQRGTSEQRTREKKNEEGQAVHAVGACRGL